MQKVYKLLIVEDERTILNALSLKFEKENFKVSTARNGEEGLKMALKTKPDLILLDIVMPVMDGMTMLKHLRKDKWGKTAQVIVLTNLSDSTVAEALENNVYDYLLKADWNISDVVRKVRERLKIK
jgi:DNA-binding response OmpR family regulator